MAINFPVFIGLRYTRSKRREGFVSFVSGFSFGAMALGVMALIVVLSVMNGFDREIKQRILNVIPHLSATAPAGIEDWQPLADRLSANPEVTAVAPFVEGQGMLSYMGSLEPVSVQGVDPAYGAAVASLEQHMLAGSLDDLAPGEYGVVLGSLLARSLNVVRGDSLLLTLPEVSVTPAGVFPRVKRLRVVGIFRVGAQVDTGIALIHLRDAARLFRTGDRIQGLRISLEDPFQARRIAADLARTTGPALTLETWQTAMAGLFQAIRMEKTVVGLLLTVIIGVAAFNIVASLVLMVTDKRKDIAVLRTLGATGPSISRIFRVQGAAVGLAGVTLGLILGCLLALYIGDVVSFLERLMGFQVFDPQVYFISRLPSHLQLADVLIVATVAVVISLLSTLYPAYRAGLIQPAEALSYDH